MNEDGTKARGIIAVIATAALVLLSGALLFVSPPAGSKEILLLVIGALIAYCTDVKQFYFGSSSGSKVLSATQGRLVESVVANAAAAAPSVLAGAGPTGKPDDPVAVKEVQKEEDPNLTKYKQMAKLANPQATDEQIAASWAALKGVDIPT